MTAPAPGPGTASGDMSPAYGGPAATMSLLGDLLRGAADSDYVAHDRAEHARTHGDGGGAAGAGADTADADAPDRSGRTHLHGRRTTVLAVVTLVAAGLVLSVSLVQTRAVAPATEAQRAELVVRVEQATATNVRLEEQVAALQREVTAAQEAALTATGGGQQLTGRLAVLEAAAAYTPVQGPGATVVLRDAEASDDAVDPDLGRVLDRDVQLVVNGLWQAGAEAIAVNGRRLTARTAIRSAGPAILVDYSPLTPPYRVEAIGPADLGDVFRRGDAGDALRDLADTYGLRFGVEDSDRLSLPAGQSTLPVLAEPEGDT
ncbi:MAG: DUF881 domain-containing protein [Candidatus Nanopelagicales bacterium]